MKYYSMMVWDRKGRSFEQIRIGEDSEDARKELQRLCGFHFVVGEPIEYFGGTPPNTTPKDEVRDE